MRELQTLKNSPVFWPNLYTNVCTLRVKKHPILHSFIPLTK